MGPRIASLERNLEVTAAIGRRLVHFSPLRYPGGKAKLAPFVKEVLHLNGLGDGVYAEPFAGGAGIAVQLLLQGYVSRIEINDLSRPIYAFWKSIRDDGERFADLVETIDLSVGEWKRQREIFTAAPSKTFELGFATFYLNRTNRSGVLNGGPIGGQNQTGNYLIDARFNRIELSNRIRRISDSAASIGVHNDDAIDFIRKMSRNSSTKTLIYADPPYFRKGRQLYYDFFVERDHRRIAEFFVQNRKGLNWLVSYDDVDEIKRLYQGCHRSQYLIPYSVRQCSFGTECMFSSDTILLPDFGPADRFSKAS
jgi:DNA adenine methylase